MHSRRRQDKSKNRSVSFSEKEMHLSTSFGLLQGESHSIVAKRHYFLFDKKDN